MFVCGLKQVSATIIIEGPRLVFGYVHKLSCGYVPTNVLYKKRSVDGQTQT